MFILRGATVSYNPLAASQHYTAESAEGEASFFFKKDSHMMDGHVLKQARRPACSPPELLVDADTTSEHWAADLLASFEVSYIAHLFADAPAAGGADKRRRQP